MTRRPFRDWFRETLLAKAYAGHAGCIAWPVTVLAAMIFIVVASLWLASLLAWLVAVVLAVVVALVVLIIMADRTRRRWGK